MLEGYMRDRKGIVASKSTLPRTNYIDNAMNVSYFLYSGPIILISLY